MKYSKAERIFVHDTLDSAFNSAYSYVVKKFGFMSSKTFYASAAWRKLPITTVQSRLLEKWNINMWEGINRGDASDLLLKRTLGALREARKLQKVESQKIKTNSY